MDNYSAQVEKHTAWVFIMHNFKACKACVCVWCVRGVFSCPWAALFGLKLSFRVTAGTFAPPSNFFHSHFLSFQREGHPASFSSSWISLLFPIHLFSLSINTILCFFVFHPHVTLLSFTPSDCASKLSSPPTVDKDRGGHFFF